MRTKFVLIERLGGYHPQFATMNEAEQLRDAGIICGVKSVTMKEIKQANYRRFDLQHFLENIAHQEFYAKYNGRVIAARVAWFNNASGVGMIRFDDQTLPIYACNIKGRKTWFENTACVYYIQGQEVEIKLSWSGYRNVFVEGLTQGTLDEEGWNRIKDQDLAFRCDEEGKAINGLFA